MWVLFALLLAPFVWAHAVAGWWGVVGLAASILGAFMLWVWLMMVTEQPGDLQAATPPKPWQPRVDSKNGSPLFDESWQDRVERITNAAELERRNQPDPAKDVSPPSQAWQATANIGWSEIERLIAVGDWDSARAALQRVSYGMVSEDEDTKARFSFFMGQFALRDPFFKAVMDAALPAIERSPGIRQAAMYKGMSEDKKELLRYVLYFAAELGHIVRVKKGNSYALYLPAWQPSHDTTAQTYKLPPPRS